jgi:hypothetical protein
MTLSELNMREWFLGGTHKGTLSKQLLTDRGRHVVLELIHFPLLGCCRKSPIFFYTIPRELGRREMTLSELNTRE